MKGEPLRLSETTPAGACKLIEEGLVGCTCVPVLHCHERAIDVLHDSLCARLILLKAGRN